MLNVLRLQEFHLLEFAYTDGCLLYQLIKVIHQILKFLLTATGFLESCIRFMKTYHKLNTL